MKKLNPITVFLKYHADFLKGKISIHKNIPPNCDFPEGFTPFLSVQYHTRKTDSAVRLTVKFKVRRLSFWQKTILPILSIPFFAGAPGFVNKIFFLNESERTFCGTYTWRNHEDARGYITGYPGKLMAVNALPNTLVMEITPLHS